MCPPGFNRRGQVFLHFGTFLAFEHFLRGGAGVGYPSKEFRQFKAAASADQRQQLFQE